jgi:N-acetylneuraminate synthase
MSQINHALYLLHYEAILLHTCSTYPASYNDLNLKVIQTLRDWYGLPVGYSGHESGIVTSVAAVALGACMVERHITIDRSMWGSDQAASLGPNGLHELVRDIRLVETALGDGVKTIMESEIPIMQKLRRK